MNWRAGGLGGGRKGSTALLLILAPLLFLVSAVYARVLGLLRIVAVVRGAERPTGGSGGAPAPTAPRRVAALLTALAAAVVAVGLVAMLGGGPARAQEEGGGGALLLIMDASGSMNETDDAGVPLIRSAKGALNGVVDALPEGTPVGLRVYGHRVPNTDRASGCRDTELISPVAPLDRAQMESAIDGFNAKGWTPIGLSLQESAGDLPPEGQSTIVLVSDGEDTCGQPPPCEAARELASQGVDVKVETVGFFVGGNPDDAEEQLRCVAEATGGTFRVAEDAEQLAEELEVISVRNARTANIQGRAVVGAAAPTEAPVLEPGSYTDTILHGETLYYGFELDEGQSARVQTTIQGVPGDHGYGVTYTTLDIMGPDFEDASDDFGGTDFDGEQPVSMAAEVSGAEQVYASGTYYVEVGLPDEDEQFEYPMEFSIEVIGGAETTGGETTSSPLPTTQATGGEQTASAPPMTGASQAEDAPPDQAQGAEPEEVPAAPAEPVAQESGGGPSATTIALLAAVGVLVVLAAGLGGALAVILLRRSGSA